MKSPLTPLCQRGEMKEEPPVIHDDATVIKEVLWETVQRKRNQILNG